MNNTWARLNALIEQDAENALSRCCGASRWVAQMLAARPFSDENALLAATEAAFAVLNREDWLEAFAHHPQIGDLNALREKFAATREWAGREQAGTGAATEKVLRDLSERNRLYQARFGFIFIICATGKSAEEMLAALQKRMDNDAETELNNAAEQQKQITRLRLEKLEL